MMNSGSVDGILSTFNKTISQLEKLNEKELDHASKMADKILAMKAEVVTAQAEADRASAVASKLRGIIEV